MSKYKALPRNRILKLNTFEFGWLNAMVNFNDKSRMKTECPDMWLQFQILTCRVYAESDGHPMQEQARADVAKFQKQLDTLREKRGEHGSN